MIGWLLYIGVILVVSGLIGMHLGRFREAYTEMTGMMAGMTMGMLNGFALGFGAASATNSMFWGNLIGILLGLALGVYFGRPGGLMGIMDGGMGGVMGGSMGAMIAIMIVFPQYGQLMTAGLLALLYLLGMAGLVVLIERSAPGHAALHRLAPFFTRAIAEEAEEEYDLRLARRRPGLPRPREGVHGRSPAVGLGASSEASSLQRGAQGRSPAGGLGVSPKSLPSTKPKGVQGRSPAVSLGVSPNTSTSSYVSAKSARYTQATVDRAGARGQTNHRANYRQNAGYERAQSRRQIRRVPGQRRSSPVSWVGVAAGLVIVVALGWWALTLAGSGAQAGANAVLPGAKLGVLAGTSSAGNLQLSLILDPDPPQPGVTTFVVQVKDASGNPVTGAQIKWSMNMTNMNMGPQGGQMTDLGSGRYQAKGVFGMAGPWRINVDITGGQASGSGYFTLLVL